MANIIGTKDNDLAFLGTPKNDTITGLGGADHLQGLEGNDALDGLLGTTTDPGNTVIDLGLANGGEARFDVLTVEDVADRSSGDFLFA
jgi:hypothetical protein